MYAEAEKLDLPVTRIRQLPLGAMSRVVRIEGGQGIARKLLALGLRSGSVIQMVHRRGRGVVVANGGNRIALGEGIAERIWVEAVE